MLLPQAALLEETDKELKSLLSDYILQQIVGLIPDEWLHWEESEETPDAIRQTYLNFLKTRRDNSEIFIKEAQNARTALI